jgi:hypothetical protein
LVLYRLGGLRDDGGALRQARRSKPVGGFEQRFVRAGLLSPMLETLGNIGAESVGSRY